MAQNLREQIASDICTVLGEITDPRLVLVTREPFEVSELAITQFPAVLVQMREENRETVTMGATAVGRRTGTITYALRAFVRGTELDRKRNDLIESIEEALDSDRYRGLLSSGVLDSQVRVIEIVDRQPPLAEITILYEVRYSYLRGSV
jgi:hypothetical protein